MLSITRHFASRSLYFSRSFSQCQPRLSGHNKWSKIKQKKGAQDAQKGAIYGKAARDIVIAIRSGGSADPTKNLQLATVLKWAKDQDVPKENIEKAIAKGTQGKDKGGEDFIYEALAFNSVGLIIECSTDNTNRTIHTVREILNGHGARATPVKFMFQRKANISLTLKNATEESPEVEKLIEDGLTAGAEDFNTEPFGDSGLRLQFVGPPNELSNMTRALMGDGSIERHMSSELVYSPSEETQDLPEELRQKVKDLVEELETNEDVLRVWTTVECGDE